jgi:hypothetical protein
MTRHSLAFTILALAGAVLTLPDPSFARTSLRPAFTGGPFRIVVPQGPPHFGGPRIGRPAMPAATPPVRSTGPTISPRPVVRSAAAGPALFRIHRRGFRGSVYPVTVYPDGAYYGAPYDPSDIPVYGPQVSEDQQPGPALAMPLRPPVAQPRGCRADQVTVPNASRGGEAQITIVRC